MDCKHEICSSVKIYREDKLIAKAWECDQCHERCGFLWGEEDLRKCEDTDIPPK